MTDPDVIHDLQRQLQDDPSQEHLWLIMADAFDEYPLNWYVCSFEPGPVIAERIRKRIYVRRQPNPVFSNGYWRASRAGLGIVEFVSCTMQTWLNEGKSLIEFNPHIRRVRISDKEPYLGLDGYHWYDGDRDIYGPIVHPESDIPRRIFSLIDRKVSLRGEFKEFCSQREARFALSDACILWAKGQK